MKRTEELKKALASWGIKPTSDRIHVSRLEKLYATKCVELEAIAHVNGDPVNPSPKFFEPARQAALAMQPDDTPKVKEVFHPEPTNEDDPTSDNAIQDNQIAEIARGFAGLEWKREGDVLYIRKSGTDKGACANLNCDSHQLRSTFQTVSRF